MKIQCSCGAKHEFEVTQEMSARPVRFVCPACGLDASEFVDGLVRQHLGQTATPSGAPVQVRLAGGAAPAPLARPTATMATEHQPLRVAGVRHAAPETAASAEAESGPQPCLKHPGEYATEKCYICSKPICPKCMELFGYVCSPLCKAKADSHGIDVPIYEGQRSLVEARRWRRLAWAGGALGLLVAALVAFWIWYSWFGSLPRPVLSVRFPGIAYAGQSVFCGPDGGAIVFLHGNTLGRGDVRSRKQVWSREILDPAKFAQAADAQIAAVQKRIAEMRDNGVEDLPRTPSADQLREDAQRSAEEELSLYVRGQNIWVASPDKVVRYDWNTGTPGQEISLPAGAHGVLARGNELVAVESGPDKHAVTHLDLITGQARTEELSADGARVMTAGAGAGSPAGNGSGALDPAKIAEQASRMPLSGRVALPATLANAMHNEQVQEALKDNPQPKPQAPKTAQASSTFSVIPAGNGAVLEVAVDLLESRIVERSAMKAPPAKSALNGNLTAGNSTEVANEMLNEMQRARGGDLVQEDLSRYQVTLRTPGVEGSWSGEVTGPPKIFPLQTVNVLAADKTMIVLDKTNKKLWQSSLNYSIVAGAALAAENAPCGQGPCIERNGSLYVFDAGVLTAFDLKTGNARWRLPSVGIAGIFFDDRDMMYVNTTTASPDSIRYQRQIDISDKVSTVVLKVDARNGKVLWSIQPPGLVSYVSGNVVLLSQAYTPQEDEEDASPLGATAATQPHVRIRRLNPNNGHEIWEHYEPRAPLDIGFDKDRIRLVFKKEVEVLRFRTWGL